MSSVHEHPISKRKKFHEQRFIISFLRSISVVTMYTSKSTTTNTKWRNFSFVEVQKLRLFDWTKDETHSHEIHSYNDAKKTFLDKIDTGDVARAWLVIDLWIS
jgi:hypothetical protein